MSVGRICTRTVDTAEWDESAQVVASRMNSRNVGTLVVLDDQKHPIGILTDRDLTVRVVAKGLDPCSVQVGSLMSGSPETVSEDTAIEAALAVMRRGPYRRILVTNEMGELVGLLSLDDILELLTEEFVDIGKLLKRESPNSLAL
jgi:CBS domain-containing protein